MYVHPQQMGSHSCACAFGEFACGLSRLHESQKFLASRMDQERRVTATSSAPGLALILIRQVAAEDEHVAMTLSCAAGLPYLIVTHMLKENASREGLSNLARGNM